MKKLLISLLASMALLLGLASCSGDLHDDVKVDPNAMKGSWYQCTIDYTGSGTVDVIVNNNGHDIQTETLVGVSVESGKSYYFVWDGVGSSELTESTRTDAPTISTATGKVDFVVFVSDKITEVALWVWNDDGNYTGGTWPGKEATKL